MQTRWTQGGNGSIEYHTHSIIGGTPTPDVRLVFARDYFLISQIQSRLESLPLLMEGFLLISGTENIKELDIYH